MKKQLAVVLAGFMLLAGCGEEASGKVTGGSGAKADQAASEKSTTNVELGKAFNVTTATREGTQKIKLTIGNYQIVQNKAKTQSSNEKYDFVQLDIAFENVGKIETRNDVVGINSFELYDQNGKEIENGWVFDFTEPDLEQAKVRPGGKNEGRMFIPIPKGTVPAELVYKDSIFSKANEYIFKLK